MDVKDFDDPEQWAKQQWGKTILGDQRRTARAVQLGTALAAQPAASLPTQTGCWGDLKAAYRLLSEPDVTHRALSQPHWRATRQQAASLGDQVVLFVQDTSALDFTTHNRTTGLGPIGDTRGKGLMMHSCLAVRPGAGQSEVIGLAAQQVWCRRPEVYRGHESRARRAKRRTEADAWGEVVEEIGEVPSGVRWISVGDRASDIFSYLRRAQARGWDCLLRVAQDRVVRTTTGERRRLLGWARGLPRQGSKTITLRGRDGRAKRTAELSVAWSAVMICAPQLGPERKHEPIQGWCLRAWEERPPAGVEALEWILLTTVPVTDQRSAVEQTEWYSSRWMIEDYHKCLKTGCAMEQRQLETAEGLLRLLGFLAIVAVRLLQLRELSRRAPEIAARTAVPETLVKVLVRRLKLKGETDKLTAREFWRGVARLGGFIGRQGDGDPGWQTLWRGWQRLQDLSWGEPLVDTLA